MQEDRPPLPGGLWRGSSIHSKRRKWLEHGPPGRPGDRRTFDTCTADSQTAGNTSKPSASFEPGDCIGHDIARDPTPNSNSSTYRLISLIHSGPQSTVWKAAEACGDTPVIAKVISTPTASRQAAALQELKIMQHITTAAADATGGAAAAPSTARHLPLLLEGICIKQQQQRQLQQQGGSSRSPLARQQRPASNAQVTTASSSSSSEFSELQAVVLVLEPLHQSLSWVLHFIRERSGRGGLPAPAVRHLAHQLLTALAELHDRHAVVHRDVKPSNLLLQQPFLRKRGKVMRGMAQHEITTAHWTLIDFGSAAQLLPPPPPPPATIAAPSPPPPAAAARNGSSSNLSPSSSTLIPSTSSSSKVGAGPVGLFSWLQRCIDSSSSGGSSSSSVSGPVPGHDSSSRRHPWQVSEVPAAAAAAAAAVDVFETPAYTPPEALLHLPSTAAHDIWSAACCIFEAATGTPLFPVEQAAAARGLSLPLIPGHTAAAAAAAASGGGAAGSSDDSSETDVGFEIDQLHLAMMKAACGQVPHQLLQRSSVARDIFADPYIGRLWIEQETGNSISNHWGYQQQQQEVGTASSSSGSSSRPWWMPDWQFPWRQQRQQQQQQLPDRPLLHRLVAAHSMSVNQALELSEFLQPMLSWDPDDRPTAAQLLQHPYFKPLRVEQQQAQDKEQQQQQQ